MSSTIHQTCGNSQNPISTGERLALTLRTLACEVCPLNSQP
uniref:Uncharacterized protein n=1 Tax=Anguilla anguilla TaxID=7936 RepID=A0A0E9U4B4_ANGAN